MRRCLLLLLLLLGAGPVLAQAPDSLNVYYGPIPEGANTYFVAPGGDDAAAGTEEAPWATLEHAVTQVQRGDVVVMRGGVYEPQNTIDIRSPSGYTGELIVVVAYPGEVPILDFSALPKGSGRVGIRLNANWWHLIGLTLRNAGHNGIRMDGSYNILEQLTAYGNGDTGIHMAGGAAHNLIKNCDSYHNYDPEDQGENADGFGAKFDIGPGNRYVGCRAWENSDDGWDFWRAGSTIVIDSSWAFGNGDPADFGSPGSWNGDGNGFKLGGDYVSAPQVVRHSMAFDNLGPEGKSKGFDYNNNPAAMTLIHNTAYGNGRNYIFAVNPPEGQAVFLNNLSASSREFGTVIPNQNVIAAGNSWQRATEVTDDMFLSVDMELAKAPRQPDGSLPEIDLFRPAPGTFLADGGVILAEPFYGAAPDVGAVELQAGPLVLPSVARGSGSVVADLEVYDLDSGALWQVRTGLAEGVAVYPDADLTIASLPAGLVVEEWIQTAAASRMRNYPVPAAQFTLAGAGVVLVAHADDVDDKPAWLADFEDTGAVLTLAGADGATHVMTLYRLPVEAGALVTLGRNSLDGDEDVPMYLVMVGTYTNVAVEEEGPVPARDLLHVYPNPVRDRATVSFDLAAGADVVLDVYDVTGRAVARVAQGYYGPGTHTVTFDAVSLPGGVYYCRMVADGFSAVRKLVRVRD